MENIIKRFSSMLFGEKTPQQIFEARRARLRQENSDNAADERVTKDALKGTTKELAQKYNSLTRALQVVLRIIVIPFNISISIFQKVQEELESPYNPINFDE